jgi:hypothetical protein
LEAGTAAAEAGEVGEGSLSQVAEKFAVEEVDSIEHGLVASAVLRTVAAEIAAALLKVRDKLCTSHN